MSAAGGLFYLRRQLFRFLCTNQAHLFKAGSFKSFSPWALYYLLDPRWEQAQSQTLVLVQAGLSSLCRLARGL